MKEKISNVINELLQRYKTVGSITDDDMIELIGVSRKNRAHYLQSQYPNSLRGIVSNIYPDSGQNTP